jgi:hypothetical protein
LKNSGFVPVLGLLQSNVRFGTFAKEKPLMDKRLIRYGAIGSAGLALLIALCPTALVSCKKNVQPGQTQSAAESRKAASAAASESSTETGPAGKIALRILYAGLPNTERAKDFVDFLSSHFQHVETTDYKTFTGRQAADFDVAIVDYDGTSTKAPHLRISPQYTRATVTIGAAGAFLCSDLSLKTGYL